MVENNRKIHNGIWRRGIITGGAVGTLIGITNTLDARHRLSVEKQVVNIFYNDFQRVESAFNDPNTSEEKLIWEIGRTRGDMSFIHCPESGWALRMHNFGGIYRDDRQFVFQQIQACRTQLENVLTPLYTEGIIGIGETLLGLALIAGAMFGKRSLLQRIFK